MKQTDKGRGGSIKSAGLQVRRLTNLQITRTILTIAGLVALIWLGAFQTNRANLLAARHAPISQPRDQLKQADKSGGTSDNQSDDVSKVVGIATLVVLLVQSWISGRQASLMRRQTDIYERQADIAEGQRQISDRQAAIMETQTALAAESLDIAIKQKEIARQGFLATNRPTIIMRAVTFTVGPHETDPLTIYWRLTNTGTFDAHVQNMVVNIELQDPKRRMQSILSGWNVETGFVLDPGETKEMSCASKSPEMTDQFHRFRNEIGILLHGYVTYFSESGRVHQLGFIRSYEDDGLLGRFKPVADPERNYSD